MLATGPAPPPPPTTTTVVATSSSDNAPAAAQQRPALRCPRCDSSNTKFCYYNNYSLSQPRHFCKSCRRYWTHGGALRNVPIGGASRKSKKPRRSSLPPPSGPTAPIVDFQLGGSLLSNSFPPLTRLNYPTNLSSPFGDLNLNPPPPPPSNLLGLNNYPLINTTNQAGGGGGGGGGDSLLASSIESLSSLNQELHWKLQQQRMSLIFDDVAPVEAVAVTTNNSHIDKKPQSIFFQNLEATNSFAHHHQSSTGGTHQDQSTNSPNINQWFFDTSYGGGGSGSGSRNNHCGDGNENEDSENVASKLNTSGGYVLDKDGVIKFQQYAQWLGMKKI